jgi:uncharacterized YccA/Bax inhibitor family protein
MEELINAIGMPLIVIAVPLVVAFLKSMFTKLPAMLIPIIAALLGPVGDFALQLISSYQGIGWTAALLGVAGVGVREIFDQLKKATSAPAPTV